MINGLSIGLNRPRRVLNPAPNNVISKIFDITSAQISASSIGWRLSPLAGNLEPDITYAGGAVELLQVVNTDEIRIQNTGGLKFPEILGDEIRVSIGPYVGPSALVCVWDTVDRYIVSQPGLYVYMQSLLGIPTDIRLVAAK